MSLQIWIAGCAKEERDTIEAVVRSSLGVNGENEPWNVSLVKVANQWSIDIDGPRPPFKGLSLVASSDELARVLSRAIQEASSKPDPQMSSQAAVAEPTASPGERRDRYDCEQCASAFEVIYQAASDEPEELAPVACPHCWHVNQVAIAAGAGLTGDYRAQAAS